MTPRVYRSIGKGKIQEEEIVSLQVRISPHLNHEGGSVNVFTQAECIVCGYYSCYKQFILWAYKLASWKDFKEAAVMCVTNEEVRL